MNLSALFAKRNGFIIINPPCHKKGTVARQLQDSACNLNKGVQTVVMMHSEMCKLNCAGTPAQVWAFWSPNDATVQRKMRTCMV